MAIRSIPNISCSLSLGSIYDVSYDYSPQNGCRITIHFINENGIFPPVESIPSTAAKANITIGNLAFSMYPISCELSETAGSKVIKVDFEDETFKLDSYYIALTNRGCGQDVFNLGTSVDKRTIAEKINEDPDIQKIKDFTQFPDLVYGFNDFLNILRQKFQVRMLSVFDSTLNQSFTGTFREVLDSWCSFYGLAYFFDNGVITICDPTTMQVVLPQRPQGALSYRRSASITNTYNKTACFYYNEQGGEVPISPKEPEGEGEGELNGLLIQSVPLYPVGSEFNSIQTSVDLNQVTAAQFGPEFWFLYNYTKGTAAAECGWVTQYITELTDGTQIYQVISKILKDATDGGIAYLDEEFFQAKYQFYLEYGKKIAGRYYYTDKRNSGLSDEKFTWFDNERQNYVKITQTTPKLSVGFLSSPVGNYKIIEGTAINEYFEGLRYDGNRILYIDDKIIDFENQFVLSEEQNQKLRTFAKNLIDGFFGSAYLDFSEINSSVKYVVFQDQNNIADILSVVNFDTVISEKRPLLEHSFDIFNIKGVKESDIVDEEEPDLEVSTTPIIPINGNINQGNQVAGLSTNGTIQVKKDSDLIVYYEKYSRCQSAASNLTNTYTRQFVVDEISTDVPIVLTAQATSRTSYRIDRDLTYLNQYFTGPLLQNLSQGWNQKEITVEFSLNYFYDVGLSFIANGLTSLSLQIAGDGIQTSYSFSNAILQVPPNPSIQQKLQESIRSSVLRKYEPTQVINA